MQEAVIHPTETIQYLNTVATQLRHTPQLTRFDDELFQIRALEIQMR